MPSELPSHGPAITIAIPFYRGLDYLKLAIASVFRQTRRDWRLLVVDNGGETATPEFMNAFDDPRIKYLKNPSNLGMAGNFNRCLELAETDLATLLHSDDELEPDYCERMLIAGAKHLDAAAFFCGAAIIDQDGRAKFSFADWIKRLTIPSSSGEFRVQGEEGLAAIMRGNFIMAPTICYRRSQIGAVRFSDDWKMVLDLDFYARVLGAGKYFVGLPERCYRYRRHPTNATSQFTANLLRFDEEIRYYDLCAERWQALGWHRASAVARRKTMIKLHVLYCAFGHLARLQWAESAKKLGFFVERFI